MKSCHLLIMSLVVLPLFGCQRGEEPVAEYEPNLVFAYNMADYSEQPMDQALAETTQALTDLFGTPDEPKVPEFITADDEYEEYAELVSLENLVAASGPIDAEGRGLYRKHCATCHGVTGNGRGPTAALLDPYPRDYRLGKFKFKSTPIGRKPIKEDIAYLIRNGINGTTMVKIPELTDADIDALVDYVIFLSWRGEVERNLLFEAGELDFTDPEEPDSLYNVALKDSDKEEDKELFEEQWELVQEFVVDVADSWVEAPDRVKEIPERDPTTVPDTFEEVLVAINSDGDSPIKESVTRGKELFLSEKTACSKCHGANGMGDGQANDYDEWSKDWTKRFGIDPEDEDSHIPLIARGALPVRKVSPRNFHEGVFRGGGDAEQLYRRIALGIEGTPMPAAAVEPEQIWDIVNFVRSLYEPKQDESTGEDPTVADKKDSSVAMSD